MLQQCLLPGNIGSCCRVVKYMIRDKWVVLGSTLAAYSTVVHGVRRSLLVAATVADRDTPLFCAHLAVVMYRAASKAAAQGSLGLINHWWAKCSGSFEGVLHVMLHASQQSASTCDIFAYYLLSSHLLLPAGLQR